MLAGEVWVALITSNRLRETALLCISIRELTSRGWITSRLQIRLIFTGVIFTGLIFTGLAGTEWTNDDDGFGDGHTQTGKGDIAWIKNNTNIGNCIQSYM